MDQQQTSQGGHCPVIAECRMYDYCNEAKWCMCVPRALDTHVPRLEARAGEQDEQRETELFSETAVRNIVERAQIRTDSPVLSLRNPGSGGKGTEVVWRATLHGCNPRADGDRGSRQLLTPEGIAMGGD